MNSSESNLRDIVNSDKCKAVIIDGKKYYIGKNVKSIIKEKEKEGGLLPLAALIPAIIAGLGGVAGVAGGVATTVNQSKQAQKTDLEKDKLQEEIKQLKKENVKHTAKGSALYLNPYQGNGISKYLNNLVDQSDLVDSEKDKLKETCKTLKNGVQCKLNGLGLYLGPYKNDSFTYTKDT